MTFDEPYPAGKRDNSAPEKFLKIEGKGIPRFTDASSALISELMFCREMLPELTPKQKERKEQLEKDAEKKFPGDPHRILRPLYVADRLAVEFPGVAAIPPLDEAQRVQLTLALQRIEKVNWQNEGAPLEIADQAKLNILRRFRNEPMPDEIRALAEKRELARLKRQDSRASLSIEDNANLDAWLTYPKDADKDKREKEAAKLKRWGQIERGDNITETAAEKAEREFPGSKDVQEKAVKTWFSLFGNLEAR
jgi:hypothetical protein